MHLRSRGWPAWLLLLSFPFAATAQQPAASPSQPSLTVDRDPIPSPDPDTAPAAAAGTPQGLKNGGAQSIGREGGRYTLRGRTPTRSG